MEQKLYEYQKYVRDKEGNWTKQKRVYYYEINWKEVHISQTGIDCKNAFKRKDYILSEEPISENEVLNRPIPN
jgi:hypothetical protein